MFEKGLGVARDPKQAVFWYERAALGGHVRAMHNLATLLASGANGKPDYASALRWYTEAAEAGFQDSQFNMGILLARGIGSKPDLPKAFQWFSLAAAHGDAEAARKRDELALRLSAADLKAAKAAVDLWRPRAADPVANQPPITAPEWTAALDRSSGNRS
jgi:localization factor PodJL